ncbi:MAG: acetyl/propionyl/methylcrotonyl-CoA carboxylase subunit alpha [Gammaproteobacteria bacterium]|nr:acetyl/propionyl/methylcrotonyl-CoA carboxylase subunit alpha [Gammaproteobacteria bacterium]
MLSQLLRRNFSTEGPKTFDKILIANRGEIARRVIKTCKKMGVKTVAVYSDADIHSMFVKEADEAYRIGAPPTNQSYLKMDTILDVVKSSGAQAVHPGYGFLSENSVFQKLLFDNGVKFLGPPTGAIESMGDKIQSKKLAKAANVNTIPGFLGEVEQNEEVIKISNEIGYPVMIKASAGGGGKGMRIAYNDDEAIEGFRLSKDEAISSFGDGRIFIEKYIEEPRHIEFQILGDEHGNYVYLPERECSVQRRNQKVIEEAPSIFMDPETRKKMGEQAVALARACDYESTGTVEFLVDINKDFYFLEMNTRLQVEHPITEEITGVDLVEQQLLIAAGYPLAMKQEDIKINGHSVEYRVYAEDPAKKFLPSIGFLRKYREPAKHEHIRIDTGVEEGSEISMYYDPMISKLVTWGKDRKEAMSLLNEAMDDYVIQGVTHNVGFGRAVINHPDFASANYNTAFIPDNYPEGYHGDHLSVEDQHTLCVAASEMKNLQRNFEQLKDQEEMRDYDTELYVTLPAGGLEEVTHEYKVMIDGDDYSITNLETGEHKDIKMTDMSLTQLSLLKMKIDGTDKTCQFVDVKDETDYIFNYCGNTLPIKVHDASQQKYKKFMAPPKVIDYSKTIISPMPGAIISVSVEKGDSVQPGQEVMVIEAMKMQNVLKSEIEGVVKAVQVKPNDSVGVDEILIEFE